MRIGFVTRFARNVPAGVIVNVDDRHIAPFAIVGDVENERAVGRPGEHRPVRETLRDLFRLAGFNIDGPDVITELIVFDHPPGKGDPLAVGRPAVLTIVLPEAALRHLNRGADTIDERDVDRLLAVTLRDECDHRTIRRPAGSTIDSRVIDQQPRCAVFHVQYINCGSPIGRVKTGDRQPRPVRRPLRRIGVFGEIDRCWQLTRFRAIERTQP